MMRITFARRAAVTAGSVIIIVMIGTVVVGVVGGMRGETLFSRRGVFAWAFGLFDVNVLAFENAILDATNHGIGFDFAEFEEREGAFEINIGEILRFHASGVGGDETLEILFIRPVFEA